MAQQIVARRQGDDFQARLFWLRAASLLDPTSPVMKVAYEKGPRGFDDIVIDYDPAAAPPDHEGRPILKKYIQCKWHVTGGTFGYLDLADHKFINAQRFSFLQRAHQAQMQYAPEGAGCRFELITNWRINPGDPLLSLVTNQSDAIHLGRLFEGTTPRSRHGRVRKAWCDHLAIDHAALELVARVLTISETVESLDSLRERLDERLNSVGLRRVPANESSFLYDDLAAKLLAQGRIEFDRESFLAMARQERLLSSSVPPRRASAVGVRSFMHPIDPLEDRCGKLLNLVQHFDGRYVREQALWESRIWPELRSFLVEAARSTDHLQLLLDAHASIAFGAGAILNVKSGKRTEVEQRTGGRHFWSIDDQPETLDWPTFAFEEEWVDASAGGLALAVSLTHDVSAGVRAFAAGGRGIGRILHCRLAGGPSQKSVLSGRHAWSLAEAIIRQVLEMLAQRRASDTHFFAAAPNAFCFFLGQHQQALGKVTVYEWDFDGLRGGGYTPGLSVGT